MGDQLIQTDVNLQDYNKKPLDVKGVAMVTVHHNGVTKELAVVVVGGVLHRNMGRNWLGNIPLKWKEMFKTQYDVNTVSKKPTLAKLMTKYEDAFSDELGCLKGMEAELYMKPGASRKPKQHFTM